MKGYTVYVTPEATADMDDAYLYMSGYASTDRSKELMSELRDEILSLHSMPLRCGIPPYAICEELGLHRMLVGKYSVFYLVDDDAASVTVTDIIWSSADLERWLGFRHE